jgi:hypothetical protein
VIAAPLQFWLYSTAEAFPVAALNFVLEFLDYLDRTIEPCKVRPRRCSRPASPVLDRGAARVEVASCKLPIMAIENFIANKCNQCTRRR